MSQAGQLADRIAAAVAGCPAVARLADGPAATYLPGRTVRGVAVRDRSVQVNVVTWYGVPVEQVAEQIRQAVAQVAPDLPVDVCVDDVEPSPDQGQPR